MYVISFPTIVGDVTEIFRDEDMCDECARTIRVNITLKCFKCWSNMDRLVNFMQKQNSHILTRPSLTWTLSHHPLTYTRTAGTFISAWEGLLHNIPAFLYEVLYLQTSLGPKRVRHVKDTDWKLWTLSL